MPQPQHLPAGLPHKCLHSRSLRGRPRARAAATVSSASTAYPSRLYSSTAGVLSGTTCTYMTCTPMDTTNSRHSVMSPVSSDSAVEWHHGWYVACVHRCQQALHHRHAAQEACWKHLAVKNQAGPAVPDPNTSPADLAHRSAASMSCAAIPCNSVVRTSRLKF